MNADVHAITTLPLRSNHPTQGQDWPGRREGLTVRESDILLLVAHGLCNQDISDRLFLSINSIKSYIRSAYRKMGVESRSQAVLWGIDHGFRRDPVRDVPAQSEAR